MLKKDKLVWGRPITLRLQKKFERSLRSYCLSQGQTVSAFLRGVIEKRLAIKMAKQDTVKTHVF